MAYITQEKKKEKALLLKPLLKEYGIKATLSISNHSKLHLNIKSGPLAFLSQYNKGREKPRNYATVTYCLEKFEGKEREFLEKASKIIEEGNHNNSNSMTDYFDIGYFTEINIGQFDKPYQLIK